MKDTTFQMRISEQDKRALKVKADSLNFESVSKYLIWAGLNMKVEISIPAIEKPIDKKEIPAIPDQVPAATTEKPVITKNLTTGKPISNKQEKLVSSKDQKTNLSFLDN